MKFVNVAWKMLVSSALVVGALAFVSAPASVSAAQPTLSVPTASKYVEVRLPNNPGPTYYYNRGGYSGTLNYIAQDSSGYIFGGYVFSN
ncbi:hypothetical protein SK066_17290 [Paenibacillus hunanensis]|uniref:hypothetical protein n=1 Tax=Paenibacillus hunanensis TaxID=539262 RepID=UPI002A69F2D6|nr:hypothetical protein [Paenibacillus hunanensis]WPP40348.1 hypothetical protein SK066_17290 [Paenibacillus hunanensis]